ncbi:MAG: hypothetical protein B7Y81_14915 [Caulobacter sp. 32-67-35]|nr:MAG: hypothetical protein B7Y81_14915 [Caulobacter sp. 32-67-35]
MAYYEPHEAYLPAEMAEWILKQGRKACLHHDRERSGAIIVSFDDGSDTESDFVKLFGTVADEVDVDVDDMELSDDVIFNLEAEMLKALNQVGGKLVEDFPACAWTECNTNDSSRSVVESGTIYEWVENFDHGLKSGVDFVTYCVADHRANGYIYSLDQDCSTDHWPVAYGIELITEKAEKAWAAMLRGDWTWSAAEEEAA